MQQQPGQNMAQTPLSTISIQPTLSSKQPQNVHPTFQQLNHQKTFNVLLKSTTPHQLSNQQQQQHHHQSQQQQSQQQQNQQQGHHHSQTYSSLLNRSGPPSTPAGPGQSLICQINSTENGAGNVYALNQRILGNMESNGSGSSNNNANVGGNGGIVGLTVGCIDNRKYDYKNKLLNNNFQATQEYNQTAGGNLSAGGNVRTNQTSSIYRGQTPNSVPRNAGNRHITNNVSIPTMYQQTMPQSMVLQNFSPYQSRQPAFQAQPYAFPPPVPHFYSIPYFHPAPLQSQAQPHQRGAVGANGSLSVGNAVQTGPNGPLAGPVAGAQAQTVPLPATVLSGTVPPPGPNTVLSGAPQNSAAQVGVGVSPMVVVPSAVTQPLPQSTKRRQFALAIIDPSTNKNILDDIVPQFPKRSSSSESDFQENMPQTQTDTGLTYVDVQQKSEFPSMGGGSVIVMTQADAASRTGIYHNIDPHHIQHREMIGQTPIVSAMSDAPSVEILPNQTKPRTKKLAIVAPKDESPNGHKEDASISRVNSSSIVLEEQIVQPSQQQAENKSCSSVDTNIFEVTAAEENSNKQQQELSSTEQKQQTVSEAELENAVSSEMIDSNIEIETAKSIDMNTVPNTCTSVPCTSIENSDDHIADIESGTKNKNSNQCTNVAKENKNDLHQEQTSELNIASIENNKVVSPITIECNDMRNENSGSTTIIAKNTTICDETDRASLQSTPLENVKPDQNTVSSEEDENTRNEKTLATDSFSATEDKRTASENIAADNKAPLRIQSLIQYNDGQWSPYNPTGKKQYDREQLLQLREAKASRVQPEVNNSSILPQPTMMPQFARNNSSSKRIQSIVGGGHRGGDGANNGSGNYANKQASMSGVNARNSTKGMIHVNLSLNQDVKLNETDNAWRPRALQKGADEGYNPEIKAEREKDDLLRRVRGILNKLTPEKFEALVDEIFKLKIDTPEKMEAIMILVFEKAVDEPNFSVSYAKLCSRLVTEVKAQEDRMEKGTKSNLLSFRNSLLDKTEEEFKQNVTQSTAKQAKLQPIVEKIKECADATEKAELEAQLEEEELRIRRRSGGTVRFIGELFKISMLTGKIINSCIEQLLNPHSEDMLECLCKLLTTVGYKLEQTLVPKETNKYYSLEKIIGRMQSIASKTDKEGAKVSSRVRFMLQDVIDLRKNKWQSKRNEAPKTMGQIEQEAKSEQLSSQYLSYGGSVSTGPSSGGGNNSLGNQIGSVGNKRDDRGGRYGEPRSAYGGSHSQRGSDSGSLRRQPLVNINSGISAGNANASGGNEDAWHVQKSRGRTLIVDSNKLGCLMNMNQDMDSKKTLGGVSQFLWNISMQTAASSSKSGKVATPSNSFAVLSLDERTDRDRDNDRDRSGPRNKGSYSKNSIERDRDWNWSDKNVRSRTGSSQVSRENSSSRSGPQSSGVRSLNASALPSAIQKSASHSKYTQQISSSNRVTAKSSTSSTEPFSSERNQSSELPKSSHTMQKPLPPAVFEEPKDSDIKLMKSVLTEIAETMAISGTSRNALQEVASSIERIPNNQKCGFIYYILTDYLHLRNVGPSYRYYLAITIAYSIKTNSLSIDHFKLAYEHFSEIASDLIVDIPELWSYIFQFTGPLIARQHITVYDLWTKQLKNENSADLGIKFLKAFLNYCTREFGPNFTRKIWKKTNLKWTDFIAEKDVKSFIETHKFAYIENESLQPTITLRAENKETHISQVVERIKYLLKDGADADSIIDFINGNIVDIEKQFIRSLTTALCKFAIYNDSSYKLNINSFKKVCIPVLQRFIQVNHANELECLYAMQLLVHDLEHPRALLCELFVQLYDADVIVLDSFLKWRDSKEQSVGKGVAVKGLNSFFEQVLMGDSSDDN